MVTVSEVDVIRKRIALTMKDAQGSQQVEGNFKKPTLSGNKKIVNKKEEPSNPFHNKLMELKKKFND